MNVINRARFYLQNHMIRNVLVILLHTGLFTALISAALIAKTATDEIDTMTQAIGNQVIVEKQGETQGELQDFGQNETYTLINNPDVAAYNIVGMNSGNIIGAEPYIADEDRFERIQDIMSP
jgi:hypothetical protein